GSTDSFLTKVALGHEGPSGGRINGLNVGKSGANVALSWFGSCSAADNNYEVYEGAIGTWYSHVPVSCATGGTTASFAPAAGNRYYLVVPRNAANEGSYGKDS